MIKNTKLSNFWNLVYIKINFGKNLNRKNEIKTQIDYKINEMVRDKN